MRQERFTQHTSALLTSSCHVNQLDVTEQNSTTIIFMQYDQHKHTFKKMCFFCNNGHILKGTRGKKTVFQGFLREKYHKIKVINIAQ